MSRIHTIFFKNGEIGLSSVQKHEISELFEKLKIKRSTRITLTIKTTDMEGSTSVEDTMRRDNVEKFLKLFDVKRIILKEELSYSQSGMVFIDTY
ncbi:MAG: hypothetical protein ABW077_19210 [Candidatus Thiodiazotropha endolucinida]